LPWFVDHFRHLTDLGEYSCPIYLLSFFLFALAFLIIKQRYTLKAALATMLAKDVWLSRSAGVDYAFLMINEFLFRVPNAVLFVFLTNALSLLTVAVLGIKVPLIGSAVAGGSVSWLLTLWVLVLLDLGSYLTHRLQHQVPFFWRFHAVHHSATSLNPLTVFRQHPVDMLLYTLLRAALLGIGTGIFSCVFALDQGVLQVAGVNAGLVIFYLTASLRHSHVPLAFPAAIRYVLFSPHLHQIHHSSAPRHQRVNFGVIFAVWDRCLGTYLDEQVLGGVLFGLSRDDSAVRHSVARLYLEPMGIEFRDGYSTPSLPEHSAREVDATT